MSVILEAKSISKKYEKGSYVLKDISLDFHASQFVAILGHSGSGKTTLLNVLSTILKPTSGKVFFKGKDITKLNKKYISELRRNEIGFVFQNYLMLSNLTVRENILVGIAKDRESIEINVLSNLLGIDKLLDKLPHELSGGEQQRVAIARAIIKRPTILFVMRLQGPLMKKIVKILYHYYTKLKMNMVSPYFLQPIIKRLPVLQIEY